MMCENHGRTKIVRLNFGADWVELRLEKLASVPGYEGSVTSNLVPIRSKMPNAEEDNYETAVGIFERAILGLACEGVDVESPQIQAAFGTLLDYILGTSGG